MPSMQESDRRIELWVVVLAGWARARLVFPDRLAHALFKLPGLLAMIVGFVMLLGWTFAALWAGFCCWCAGWPLGSSTGHLIGWTLAFALAALVLGFAAVAAGTSVEILRAVLHRLVSRPFAWAMEATIGTPISADLVYRLIGADGVHVDGNARLVRTVLRARLAAGRRHDPGLDGAIDSILEESASDRRPGDLYALYVGFRDGFRYGHSLERLLAAVDADAARILRDARLLAPAYRAHGFSDSRPIPKTPLAAWRELSGF